MSILNLLGSRVEVKVRLHPAARHEARARNNLRPFLDGRIQEFAKPGLCIRHLPSVRKPNDPLAKARSETVRFPRPPKGALQPAMSFQLGQFSVCLQIAGRDRDLFAECG